MEYGYYMVKKIIGPINKNFLHLTNFVFENNQTI